ncbi:MAG: hypothetical protein KAI99_15190, partial [Cyclobacteriaceae bacterium]|nr:hypothetical protein [Cyclobacteriaceae bacterium]
LFTWVFIFIIYFLFNNGTINRERLNILYTFGCLGPTFAALLVTSFFYKKQGLRKLFVRLSFNNLNRKSLLIAFSPIAFFFVG